MEMEFNKEDLVQIGFKLKDEIETLSTDLFTIFPSSFNPEEDQNHKYPGPYDESIDINADDCSDFFTYHDDELDKRIREICELYNDVAVLKEFAKALETRNEDDTYLLNEIWYDVSMCLPGGDIGKYRSQRLHHHIWKAYDKGILKSLTRKLDDLQKYQ